MAQIDQVATKKTGSTGSYLGDVEQTIQTYPCFRSSLLPGIVSGAGFGFIRGMSTKNVRIAGNWTVGTFVIVSTAGW
ncbi:hypothetical protein DL96DRAFT_1618096 [Flagelloscypha sp. PMI_526]|nr:hypothetical protein DL96DRAFT_1618096 [Flagelloscypha sp. PMI_526]